MTSRNDSPPEPYIQMLEVFFFATEPNKARVICKLFQGGGFDGSLDIVDLEAIPEVNQIAHRLITIPIESPEMPRTYDYIEIRFAARNSVKPAL